MSDKTYVSNLEEQIKRLKLLQYLNGAINSTKSNIELLELMLDQSIALTKATSGSIMLKDRVSNELRFVAFRGIDEDMVKNTKIVIGDGVTGLVFQEAAPKLVNDVELEPKYIRVRKDIKSELVVPLNVNNKVIGVISMDSNQKNAFTEQDLELLLTISNQAAQTLAKTMLTEKLERKIQLQELLIEFSTNLEKVRELKDAFDLVMKQLADRFQIMRGMLVLFKKEALNELSVYTAYNLLEDEMSRGNYRVGEGIIGKVVETGKPISIPNIFNEKNFLDRMQIRRDRNIPVSFIAIPIKIDGVVSGVMAVEKEFEGDDFLQDEENLLFLIGNIISNKVKTYQRVQEERNLLLEENRKLKKELYKNYGTSNIIGKNRRMIEVYELVELVADSNSSILILGESGTGKELVARSLHYNSSRREKPFISVNCASIPENLLESELFGHKKGAFTGAAMDKKGKFELANGGTLFLDEIGDMPHQLQAKLLRSIQEREIEPIGSEKKIKVDIRIISATNKDLAKLIRDGKFREDLYYRLNVVEINIPPLRDRRDDIPLLATHFIEKYAKRNNRTVNKIAPEVLRIMQAYNWQGNVRELENAIERAVLLCRGDTIEINHLPPSLVESGDSGIADVGIGKWIDHQIKLKKNHGRVYEAVIGFVEKELITKALIHNKRNKVKTSEFLGINRNTLRFKMGDYEIKV
jgi:Nif-specific regulatory protein